MSETPVLPERKMSASEQALVNAREKLSRYVGRAVEILTELAESSENDRVRLSAADSILDRAGLGKSYTTQVQVNQGEHEAARKEAEDVVARIKANKPAINVPPVDVSLEALVVLEGVLDEEVLAG